MSIEIETGIPGTEQESSFINATIQTHGEDRDGYGGIDFSIATKVTVPDSVKNEADLARYLEWVLGLMDDAVPAEYPWWEGPSVSFEVQIGPGNRP